MITDLFDAKYGAFDLGSGEEIMWVNPETGYFVVEDQIYSVMSGEEYGPTYGHAMKWDIGFHGNYFPEEWERIQQRGPSTTQYGTKNSPFQGKSSRGPLRVMQTAVTGFMKILDEAEPRPDHVLMEPADVSLRSIYMRILSRIDKYTDEYRIMPAPSGGMDTIVLRRTDIPDDADFDLAMQQPDEDNQFPYAYESEFDVDY